MCEILQTGIGQDWIGASQPGSLVTIDHRRRDWRRTMGRSERGPGQPAPAPRLSTGFGGDASFSSSGFALVAAARGAPSPKPRTARGKSPPTIRDCRRFISAPLFNWRQHGGAPPATRDVRGTRLVNRGQTHRDLAGIVVVTPKNREDDLVVPPAGGGWPFAIRALPSTGQLQRFGRRQEGRRSTPAADFLQENP